MPFALCGDVVIREPWLSSETCSDVKNLVKELIHDTGRGVFLTRVVFRRTLTRPTRVVWGQGRVDYRKLQANQQGNWRYRHLICAGEGKRNYETLTGRHLREPFFFLCKYSNMSQNTRITIGLYKITNTFTSADEMTGDAPTAHTGLALCSRCHPAWASEGTLVGPGKDTHGTPVLTQWEGRGWPTTSCTRNHQHDKTKLTAPRLGYQQGIGAGSLRPQIYEAPTDAWRQG